ncbi:hypothetical protein F5Y18DRAFT_439370 [Xylariaceae sp. FL1019]|nr:hypothetical protein F5Y18DRAFT_439370 [Xylariaceae sp. FL1019]
MASPRFTQSPTCLSCLRRIAQPATPSPLTLTQIRTRTTKAELEDLQGIAVRLLRDIPKFGRKDAIIRVKGGRMRNIWFPKGQAEYMTKKRFEELGLTEAAIGTRDRTFGQVHRVESQDRQTGHIFAAKVEGEALKQQPKVSLALPADDVSTLLTSLLPEILTFERITGTVPDAPAPEPKPEPAVVRSPGLAANAAMSKPEPVPESAEEQKPEPIIPIFGSVSKSDILSRIKEFLSADEQGSRAALEEHSISISGLDPAHDALDRIKRLGRFEILIYPGVGSNKLPLKPVKRVVEIVAPAKV